MKKRELRTALKAAAHLTRLQEFYLIGSQAIHAHCERSPAEVLLSQECDLYPCAHPELGDLIHRELGRNSVFARKHGFYVDVVAPELASLPEGWRERVKKLRVGRITAFCPDVYDLLASKLAAGRLKDLELVGAVLKLRLAKAHALQARIAMLCPESVRAQAELSLKVVLREVS